MIPTEQQAKALWDIYQLPQNKRLHCTLVAQVTMGLARECQMLNAKCQINKKLLIAAALLHDIDKNAPKLPGEEHPDAAVRILKEEDMGEVAALVATHPLHAILDPSLAPKTWEEKILFLADKMVKHEIVGVDRRFALWNAEHLPAREQAILDTAYPKVKALEKELAKLAGKEYTRKQ